MNNVDKNMLLGALMQKDVYPKALANFMFREIIEDAHEKYRISQDDMKEMCKQAVNRAAIFLAVKSDPALYKAFAIYAIAGYEWDESEVTGETDEQTAAIFDTLRSLAD